MQAQPAEGEDYVKLFVGQVPRDMVEDPLREIFAEFGNVLSVSIIRDRQTGLHRGCAFVVFESSTSATAAIAQLHGKRWVGNAHNPLQVKLADSRSHGTTQGSAGGSSGPGGADKENKLFLGMLPRSVEEEQIRAVFERFGEIKEVHVMRDQDGNPKGCAFLKFFDRAVALRAIDESHDQLVMEEGTRPVIVKFADNKGKGHVQGHRGGGGPKHWNRGHRPPGHNSPPSPHGSFHFSHQQPPIMAYPPQYMPTSPPHSPIMGQGPMGQPMNYMPGTLPGMTYGPGFMDQNPTMNNMNGFGAMRPPVSPNGQTSPPHMGMNPPHMNPMNPMTSLGPLNTMMPSSIDDSGLIEPMSPLSPGPPLHPPAPAVAAQLLEQSQGAQSRPREGPAGANLFIYHLPHDLTDADLATLFTTTDFGGSVVSAKVYVDKKTGESKGFGFVSFDTPQAAENAIMNMNGFQIGNKRLKVQLKREKNMRGNDRRGYPDQRQHFPPGWHSQGPGLYKYPMPAPPHMVPPPLMGQHAKHAGGAQAGPAGDYVQLDAPQRVPGAAHGVAGVPTAAPDTAGMMGSAPPAGMMGGAPLATQPLATQPLASMASPLLADATLGSSQSSQPSQPAPSDNKVVSSSPAVTSGDVSDPQSPALEDHLAGSHVTGAMGPGVVGVGEGVEGATLGIGNLSL